MSAQPLELTGKAPKPGRYAKVSLFLRKRSDLSDEYFHAYWANNHVTPAFQNKTFMDKARRYNQHHVTAEERARAEECGIPVLEYDGIAEVWLDSFDDWKAITSDTDFVKNVASDEANFLQSPIHIMFGWDYLLIGKQHE
ncbi:ethD domain-containing protein [Sarocladium implicatum]|nr:ethD domain-containing protein [Sarocladium implicatum]